MNLIYLRGGRKRCHALQAQELMTVHDYSLQCFLQQDYCTLDGFQHDFIMTLILSFKAPFLKLYACAI